MLIDGLCSMVAQPSVVRAWSKNRAQAWPADPSLPATRLLFGHALPIADQACSLLDSTLSSPLPWFFQQSENQRVLWSPS